MTHPHMQHDSCTIHTARTSDAPTIILTTSGEEEVDDEETHDTRFGDVGTGAALRFGVFGGLFPDLLVKGGGEGAILRLPSES